MRSIWTGSIAFGLVNVPVKAYGATRDHDIDLHQVHDADGGRIRYQRRCEICGKKIAYEHIDKAFDEGERTVVLNDEDMASLPAEKSREIEVVQFVPNDQIDPIMLERSYYLEPDSKSPKAYLLLVETLENTELSAVVKFALRQKTRLGALRVRGRMLVLQGILWDDEVREAEFPATAGKKKISPQELKMSQALVDQFKGDFNPAEFTDEYQLELRTLIDAKLKHGDSLDTAATFGETEATTQENDDGGSNVIDLMEALKRSIDKKRAGSGNAQEEPSIKADSSRKTSTAAKSVKAKMSPKGAPGAAGRTSKKQATDHTPARKTSTKPRKPTKGKSTKGKAASHPGRAVSEHRKGA